MSNLTFRPATIKDVVVLVRLMQAAWPDDVPDEGQIASVLRTGDHLTLLARRGEQVVGFVDCFGRAAGGLETWEVDLLAVEPVARGQGVASAIIEQVTQVAVAQGYDLARALVAVGNAPMQKVMSKAGYVPSATAHALMISNGPLPEYRHAVAINEAEIIPVSTLTYHGGWLLPPFTTATLATGAIRCEQEGWSLVGAVTPHDEPETIQDAQMLGYKYGGDYDWWEKVLE